MQIEPAIDNGMQSLSPRTTFLCSVHLRTVATADMPQSICRSQTRAYRRNLISSASCMCMTIHAGYYILTGGCSLIVAGPVLPIL
jgi:hypothetical protein